MSNITGTKTITSNDLYSSFTAIPSGYEMGDLAWGANGKGFRLALAGNTTIVMGNLLQEAAQDTTYENMAVTSAGAAGDYNLNVTNGTATITDEQFRGGSLSIYTAGTIAIGDEYTILGVTGTLTTGGALVVALDRPLRAAVTTSAKVNMKRSAYSGVIQFPASTQTGVPVGGAMFAGTANQYLWIQSKGAGAVLSDGSTFAVGTEVGTPSATAGAVTVYAAGTTHIKVANARMAAAASHAIAVNWMLD